MAAQGMTVKEASRHYHKSPSTIRTWARAKKVPARKVERRWQVGHSNYAGREGYKRDREHFKRSWIERYGSLQKKNPEGETYSQWLKGLR